MRSTPACRFSLLQMHPRCWSTAAGQNALRAAAAARPVRPRPVPPPHPVHDPAWLSPPRETRSTIVPAALAESSSSVDKSFRRPALTTYSRAWQRAEKRRRYEAASDVEVDDFERVLFDELAPLLDVFPHQRGENLLGLDDVLEFHLEQRARFRVHGGFPELRGIHLAQALEPGDGELLLRVFEHEGQHVSRPLFHYLVAVARDDERRPVRLGNGVRQRA